MKITVKILSGETFHVDVDGGDSVTSLKKQIENERTELAAARQKLIHVGKVLKDDQILSELGLIETDFIVCMLAKEAAKDSPAPVAAPTAPASTAPHGR